MATILVTGGCGFIGTNLARELRLRGHETWTCDLFHSADPHHIRVDTTEHRQIINAIRRVEPQIVYHLAAEYGRWNGEEHYERLWSSNLIGTRNILECQKEYGFRVVFFSSAEVYGDYSGTMTEEVVQEHGIEQLNDYAISKWAGEMQCLNFARMHGNEIVRVRPVGCYGPHEYPTPYRGVIPIFAHAALNKTTLRVHRGHRRIFDYVDDTCRTLANIVDSFRNGSVYNVGGRKEWAVSIEELAELIVAKVGAPASLIQHAGPEPHTTVTKLVDSSLAEREIGHNPTIDLDEGLDRYLSWLRRQLRL